MYPGLLNDERVVMIVDMRAKYVSHSSQNYYNSGWYAAYRIKTTSFIYMLILRNPQLCFSYLYAQIFEEANLPKMFAGRRKLVHEIFDCFSRQYYCSGAI